MSSGNKVDNTKLGAIRRQRLFRDGRGCALLVALDDIHYRAGGPRAQLHYHADAPCQLPEPQVSNIAWLAALSFRRVTPVRAIPTTCVRGAASEQAFCATCCSTTAVPCGMLEVACFPVYSLLLVVL